MNVGDVVRCKHSKALRGVVSEDRGNLGVGGRRILRLRLLGGSPIEIPEEELEPDPDKQQYLCPCCEQEINKDQFLSYQ